MQRCAEATSGLRRRRSAPLLAALLLASACASPGTRSARLEILETGGFAVSEEAAVGDAVRADFDEAVRLLQSGEYQRGIALLVRVTETAPELTTPHIDLAMAYRQTNDLAAAEASIERALALSPRHPVALNELGIVQRRLGRFRDARQSYEKALAVYPDFHFARRNLAILCDVYLADPACALEHYDLYARAVPEDEAVAMWVADLRNRSGR